MLARLRARGIDRFALYERAVQSPERDVDTLAALFRARAGREAVSLREDFCGTAALAIAWVGSDDDRTATAIDLDREVIAVARDRARARLDREDRVRLRIVRRDVRARSRDRFDLIVAPNFSWALFEDDRELARYFASCARSLESRGLLALETFGGSDLRRALVHRERHSDFTYVWEQRGFDDGRGILDARIHFELGDGRALRDAFRYSFRLRPLAQVESLLAEAGLPRAELVIGGRTVAREPSRSAWHGHLLAQVGPRSRRP